MKVLPSKDFPLYDVWMQLLLSIAEDGLLSSFQPLTTR